MFSVCAHNVPLTRCGDADDDPETGSHITVPAPGYVFADRSPVRPSSLSQYVVLNRFPQHCLIACSVFQWVLQYPLETVRRMMYLTFPEMDYTMEECIPTRRDENVIRWALWRPSEAAAIQNTDKPRVTIFVQPPWLVTEQDMALLARCASVRELPTPASLLVLIVMVSSPWRELMWESR